MKTPFPRRRSACRILASISLWALCLAAPGGGASVPGAAAQEQFVMKLGTPAAVGSPRHAHLRAVARHIEEVTGGHLRVKVLAGGALGPDAEVLPRLTEGSVQAYATGVTALSSVAPNLGVLAAPYVFAPRNRARRQLDGNLSRAVGRELERAGLLFGSWSVAQPRLWLSRRKPIRRPRDLRGRRAARATETALDATAEALHMTPVDVTRPLLPAAARAAEIDVIDDTLPAALATGRDRWARHLNLSEHARAPWLLVYSARWFQGLPEQVKKDLRRLPRGLLQDARAGLDALRPALLERLRARGVQIHEPTKAERRAFVRATRPVTRSLAAGLGPGAQRLLRAAGAR